MHQLIGADDFATENLTDGLVSEADAEQRSSHNSGALYHLDTDTGAVRIAGARREDDASRIFGKDRIHRHNIVAVDLDLGAEFPQKMHKVVGKAVVVIN